MYKPYKILMLATSMEYGGGETHILELSKYLALHGIEVKIMTNGGEFYEKGIEGSKIEHIYAPFHSRKISDMGKAGKILKETIKSYSPDIIHAHNRIPAFVASGICKKSKIPLVTTMHGTFKQSFLLKLATRWGGYSLYVSDDIKEYWQKYYDLKDGYMAKTVNGINTELFSPAAADGDLRREFAIKPEEKIILSISRLEQRSGFDLSFSAGKLCDIAEDIYANEKNTRIVIVGDGENFGDIKNKAGKINEKIGFEYIIMAGRRTDAYKFCAACGVSVGISRFALESISCAKPVVLCGGMGYMGRFTKDNSDICERSNFTCRGFGYPEDVDKALLGDILFCLDEKNKEILSLDAKFGAELIRKKYSVEKMADDAYSAYQKAALKYKNCDFVLGGYYGYGNIGDDALMHSVIGNILQKKSDVKICLLTKNPKKQQRRLDGCFANIVAKPRFNFPSVKKAIKKSKALVFGGGTLLQDATSGRSFGYYSWLLKTAQKLGKKTILYANGIGPLYEEKNKERTKLLMQKITAATIRDRESYDILEKMGIDNDKITLTEDEAMTIGKNSHLNSYEKDFKEFIKGEYIVISARKQKHMSVEFLEKFSAAVNAICRSNNLIPVYLVMHPKEDRKISEYLSSLDKRAYLADVGGDISKALAIVRSAEAVVAMRLHALIFAAVFEVPMIGIAYDPKLRSFLGSIYESDAYTCPLKNFSKEALTDKFSVLISNKEEIKGKIKSAAKRQIEKAEKNAGLFLQAMEMETGEN
ncbi:MAG: polysaccharide pyruvyl transferase CsaB [Oscillospiraceae bacterium]|nr:polysaccharide pyruvyl transferase CsaB [Oscillospiraceae bacterium]